MWCWMDMQGDECSGDGDHADTQPDVPLLMYVRLRTPGVPQRPGTPVLRPIVSRNVPDAIHNSDQFPPR